MFLERILLKFRKVILSLLSLFLVISLVGGVFIFKAKAQSQGRDIGVTATVEAWLTFTVSTTTVSLTPPLVQSDGSLNIGTSPDIILNIGTNAYGGWQVRIKGANGGLKRTNPDYTIPTVNATGTVATGTEAYGANADDLVSGVTIGEYYDYYGTNTVGQISTQDSSLASKTSPNSPTDVVKMMIKASARDTTPPGNYSDTITLTALATL